MSKVTVEFTSSEYNDYLNYKNKKPYAIIRHGCSGYTVEFLKKDKALDTFIKELDEYKKTQNKLLEEIVKNESIINDYKYSVGVLKDQIEELNNKPKKPKLSWLNPF